jgi:hypothetical protein
MMASIIPLVFALKLLAPAAGIIVGTPNLRVGLGYGTLYGSDIGPASYGLKGIGGGDRGRDKKPASISISLTNIPRLS